MNKLMNLDRRGFLKAAGVALALPVMDVSPLRVSAQSKSEPPRRRMVLIDLTFGLHAPNFFPKKAGRDYELTPYLQVLKEFRNDFTVISGVSHPEVDGGHMARVSFLTAAPRPLSPSFKNSISVDQVAAARIGDKTRFSSLSLSSLTGTSISFTHTGVEIPPDRSPAALFAKLFLDGTEQERQRQIQKLKDGQSVMDSVLDQAKRMQKRMGTSHGEKLDQYFTAVRETEQALLKSEAWQLKPKAKVNVPPPKDITDSSDIIGRSRLMYDLMHLALQTDSTRLITFLNSGINGVPVIDGVTQDYHALSHHAQVESRLAELKLIEEAQLKVFGEFLQKLRSTKEEGATLLDNTMVLLGSEMGNANSHDCYNLPTIIAGGGFKHGQHLAFNTKDNYPLPNLFVTMLQRLGLEIDKFASSTGTMRGLEV